MVLRRAFTLVELLVVIGIMAAMVTTTVVGVRSGKAAAQVRAAARDVAATIRIARSTAMVTGQRVVVSYSNEKVGDSNSIKIEVISAKMMDVGLKGEEPEPYFVKEYKDLPNRVIAGSSNKVARAASQKAEATATGDSGEGDTIEDVLFAPISAEVVENMCIKAVRDTEAEDDGQTEAQRKNRISVSSNVDWLLNKFEGLSKKNIGGETSEEKKTKEEAASTEIMQGSVSVVWQTSGAVDAHKVWVYSEGQKPEDGLLISIDHYGGMKIMNGDGEEEDE